MNPVQEYLRLASTYCQYLGGLRWSSNDDTIVYPDERTFAFNPEIASFLEGFGRQHPLIHFGHILHLLDLLRNSRKLTAGEPRRLRSAFAAANGFIENAGAFFAVICQDVPYIPLVVDVQDVCERLRHPAMPIRWFIVSFHDTFHPTLGAPLAPEEFEARILRAVAAYSDAELRHWFRHGQGVVKEVGDDIARQMAVPRTLSGVLAALLERPRLAGAQAYVAQLVSALTLPPRRLSHQELPVGGYADVTTHGPPEQILVGQFALDAEDFFRRFADRELLYYRREEPQARSRQELVVLLDQGVRTWGDVRLVLTAAALAFGKQAARRKMPFYLAGTSNRGALIDPLEADDEELGRVVEASDLSANPGLALESVLEQHAEDARDVVLLTHPRNLREPDVRTAGRRVAPGTRLFAVALDTAGSVDLVELRHGAPVPVRHFQVSRPIVPVRPAIKEPEYPGEPRAPWTGDVEPIGFPFRFGVSKEIVCFDFDYEGEWLLTAAADGMLLAYRINGNDWEILPRGIIEHRPLTRTKMVLGIRGGFVVGGCLDDRVAALHYDFIHRTCKTYVVGAWPGTPVVMKYSPERHAALIDLAWKKTHQIDLARGTVRVVSDAAELAQWGTREPVHNWHENRTKSDKRWYLFAKARTERSGHIEHGTGVVCAAGLGKFTPLADGLPALRDWFAEDWEVRQETVALLTRRRSGGTERVLRLYRGPSGIPAGEYPTRTSRPLFMLSGDGQHLARLCGEYCVEVNRVGGDNGLRLSTRAGGFSSRLRFALGEDWLFLATTRNHRFLLRWHGPELEVLSWHNREAGVNQDGYYFTSSADRGCVQATQKGVPALAYYDRERFVLGTSLHVLAVADRFGQVAIFDVDQRVISMFFAFRERIAAWMPDGTRYGPPSLTGGPETPDALTKIGQALREASERGAKRPGLARIIRVLGHTPERGKGAP